MARAVSAITPAYPIAAGVLASAPDRINKALLAVSAIQAACKNDLDQVTIWATTTQDQALSPPPAQRPCTGTAPIGCVPGHPRRPASGNKSAA